MAWRYEKETGDIVINGWENGIAVSPHKGIANIQNANISTETGEVMVSYGRALQTLTSNKTTGGALTFRDSTHVNLAISGSNNLFKGFWITTANSSHPGEVANQTYWVTLSSGGGFQLSATYNGSALTGLTSGLTADFTILRVMGQPVGSATETYSTGSALQYRYYILDLNGLVWVYDTALASATDNISWFLPDNSVTYFTAGVNAGSIPTGIAILNGWLHVFAGSNIWCKPTVLLGTSSPGYVAFASGVMQSPATSPNPHFAYVGHQGKLYYTDGNYLGSILPNTGLITGANNVQSYASYTASTTTGTISALVGGSVPYANSTTIPIPVVFFTGGTLPSAITANTIYYVLYSPGTATFQVFNNFAMSNPAIDIATGSVGTQYFSTYHPASSGGKTTITFSPQRLNLPFFETAQSIIEIGDNVVVGTKGNVLYPWNQISPLPGDLIPIPENNAVYMLTVNNMAYVFAGNKGNIYITNGSTASLALTIPDYCAGIAGTESSYIEPYFTWGGAAYIRGRVYFSILDQTASKAGNCGGIWSFVPTQNFFIGQDTGLALRQENQNSYATYSGVATVILPSQTQSANSPQYWSAWYSSVSSPTYGIDFTESTFVSAPATIETDLIPTGNFFDKQTFEQIEYKLSAPLKFPESVSIGYRKDSTSAYVDLGPAIIENVTTETTLSGYFPAAFEKTQWLQLYITLTPSSSLPSNSSFVRLKEIRVR